MGEVSHEAVFRPVTFAGCVGHAALGPRETGILLCSPWGFEDLSSRKSWRVLAEQVAAAGFPCLRFDHPGTGDALGDAPSLDAWLDGIRAAAGTLADLAGTTRLTLVGQGLGATLAYLAAGSLPGLDGLVLMAPAVKGRSHLRELAAWERMISGSMGYATAPPEPGGLTLAGFAMPAALVDALRAVDLAALAPPTLRRALIVTRPKDAASAERLSETLAEAGSAVEVVPFEGYDALVENPMSSVVPRAAFAEVLAWLERGGEPAPGRACPRARAEPDVPAPLTGPHFTERPLRFGPGGRLFGILCEPRAPARPEAALIVNTGSDHHIGWGRIGVAQARSLAEAGIASLRYDSAGLGDSPPRPGAPDLVIYSDGQTADARDALDCLEAAGYPAARIVGRCSGGYLALSAALADRRVTGLVLVNLARFRWNPAESVEEALRFVPRSLNDYGSRVVGLDLWRRMLRGEVDLVRAGANMANRIALRIAPRLVRGRGWSRLHDRVHADLAALRDRNVAVALVYAAGDSSLEEYASHLGGRSRGLARYPNMSLTLIPHADHNFTQPAAKRELFETVARHLGGG